MEPNQYSDEFDGYKAEQQELAALKYEGLKSEPFVSPTLDLDATGMILSEQMEHDLSMKSTGLIDSEDWNDSNYPDYYLLGC